MGRVGRRLSGKTHMTSSPEQGREPVHSRKHRTLQGALSCFEGVPYFGLRTCLLLPWSSPSFFLSFISFFQSSGAPARSLSVSLVCPSLCLFSCRAEGALRDPSPPMRRCLSLSLCLSLGFQQRHRLERPEVASASATRASPLDHEPETTDWGKMKRLRVLKPHFTENTTRRHGRRPGPLGVAHVQASPIIMQSHLCYPAAKQRHAHARLEKVSRVYLAIVTLVLLECRSA